MSKIEPVAYTVLPELLADVGMSVINAELPKGTKVYAVPPDTAALQARITKLEAALQEIAVGDIYTGGWPREIARTALEGS